MKSGCIRSVSYILAMSALLSACKKENLVYTYAEVSSVDVNVVAGTGADFAGRIDHISEAGVTSHGFVWDIHTIPTVENSHCLDLGPASITGNFTAEENSSLTKNFVYYFRAFVIDQGTVRYGDAIPFTSLGSLGPEIDGFSPDTGSPGELVKVYGSNFQSELLIGDITQIYLESLPCPSLAEYDSILWFIVPDTEPGFYSLTVSTLGNRNTSDKKFEVK
jgi:hypothetical protein